MDDLPEGFTPPEMGEMPDGGTGGFGGRGMHGGFSTEQNADGGEI